MFKKWGFFHQTSIFWDIKKPTMLWTLTPPPPSTKQDERGTVLHSFTSIFEVLFKVDVISIRAKVPFLK